MFNLFRLCRKDEISFDIVAETGNIVARNGNNVESTFDIVERIVQLVAFVNIASTLLLVWTGLKLTAPETISRSRDMVGTHKYLNGPRDQTTPLSGMVCRPYRLELAMINMHTKFKLEV